MGWTFVYLMLILKIPIVALLAIVWWAIRSAPEESTPENADDGGGPKTRRRHPHRPLPRHPRTPRRGPHGDPLPLPPPRTRTLVARARRTDRA